MLRAQDDTPLFSVKGWWRAMVYRLGLPFTTALLIAACGGDRSATRVAGDTTVSTETGAAAGETRAEGSENLTLPSWMKVDRSAKTVSADIEAGKTAENNHWNFNGYYNGNATIAVPAGYKVTIQFKNDDPAVAHSIGVDSKTSDFPAMWENPQPVFSGAISENPTSLQGGTSPGKSTKISFTADKPGNYSLVCFMPGHAAAGMWVHFKVSSDGETGVAAS